jgi:DNA-binding SARP family transcriptional activator
MLLSEMVIRSKITPPQSNRATLHRVRLQEKFSDSKNYPLTLIHAGTGFGKTTALLDLSGFYPQVFWYNITEPDRDPTLFLAHLISAFFPNASPLLDRLEQGGLQAVKGVLTSLINSLTTSLEEDAVLILDDFHLVNNVKDINLWLEMIVEQRPPHLHIAIASRQIPETPAFVRWRVKGNVLVIDQGDLSFSREEISQLFSEYYHFPITPEQAQALYAYTDGWIIALQMIWQRLQSSREQSLDVLLTELPSAFADVFNYLAQDVLAQQPDSIQRFLLSTAILRQMDAAVCNTLLEITDSQELLRSLTEKGLFIFTADNSIYRYQRLFQDFLLEQTRAHQMNIPQLHLRAAEYFSTHQDYEEAVYHRFAAGDLGEAANLIEMIGPKLLEIGRLRTLSKWIDQLEVEQLEVHPFIYLLKGDVLRLRSKFEEAITAYGKAEKIFLQRKTPLGRSQALRSMAQVYLDTIRPLKASSLLQEAIGLLEPQEHPAEVAALLDQLAENKLNQGKPREAEELHKEASLLRSESDPDAIYLEARSMLRTGRLREARDLLESYGANHASSSVQRPQRFHREMPLLLSLIYIMLGDYERGAARALQGIDVGRQLDSPFVEAVGLMRLGHAYQMRPRAPWRGQQLEKSRAAYEKSIDLVKPFNVMRVQVEPLWGLCRLYGYQGAITEAKRYASQAIEIAETSGDLWFAGLLRVTMGTSYMLIGEVSTAETWLNKGVEIFEQVGDIFGQAMGSATLALTYWLHGGRQQALDTFARIAPQLRVHDLDFLLTQTTLLGMQDDQSFYPLLIEAAQQGIEKDWIGGILKRKNLEGSDFHPGYGLSIRTLGLFEVWRGDTLVTAHDWQREKARQLLQFLINNPGKWFTREQITDRLWPNLDADAAKNFKVTLNALNRALEPQREPGQTPFFISRREALYSLNSAARIELDMDDFSRLCASDREEDLLQALSIYTGDYLVESVEEYWANETRERLRDAYLHTASHLGEIYFEQSRLEEAIKLCHEILAVDNCNEPAYRLLMRCHAARGNRSTVQSVYQRCISTLREELDIDPSAETVQLWELLSK